MIIVEGPDGSGKTTLVNELCSRMGLMQGVRQTADRDKLYETTVDDSFNAVLIALSRVGPPMIWDRMFYSDPIYAEIVRDEVPRFTVQQYEYLDALVNTMRAPVIICLPPFEVVRDNVVGGHQMNGVVENIEAIYNRYHQVYHSLPNAILYDYTEAGAIPKVMTHINQYLRIREEQGS